MYSRQSKWRIEQNGSFLPSSELLQLKCPFWIYTACRTQLCSFRFPFILLVKCFSNVYPLCQGGRGLVLHMLGSSKVLLSFQRMTSFPFRFCDPIHSSFLYWNGLEARGPSVWEERLAPHNSTIYAQLYFSRAFLYCRWFPKFSQVPWACSCRFTAALRSTASPDSNALISSSVKIRRTESRRVS